MEGIIVNFRGSNHVKSGNQMIILPKGSDSKDKAAKLVGKTVTWTSPAGKELKGNIRAAHGGNGAVRVLFSTGMPGQAIGTAVKIE